MSCVYINFVPDAKYNFQEEDFINLPCICIWSRQMKTILPHHFFSNMSTLSIHPFPDATCQVSDHRTVHSGEDFSRF